jgi:hypothetical protein
MKRGAVAKSLLLGCLIVSSAGCGGASQSERAPDMPVPASDPAAGEPEAAVDDSGMLDIVGEPGVEVLLDGKPVGKTPVTNLKVTPGNHDVTFVDPAEGNRTMGVIVNPGDHTSVKTDRAPPIREGK